jgi:hypothetical protein
MHDSSACLQAHVFGAHILLEIHPKSNTILDLSDQGHTKFGYMHLGHTCC